MKRFVNLALAHRVLSMMIAIAMVISMVPVSVFAATPSTLTMDMGSKSFTVGTATEFTLVAAANDDAGATVQGSFAFSDANAVEKLEYKESQDAVWTEIDLTFGAAEGFSFANAVYQFRVTFKKAGIFTVDACIKAVDGGAVLCQTQATVSVAGHSSLATDVENKSFVKDEATEFSITTMANEDAGATVLGSLEFSNADSLTKLEYKASQDGEWSEISGAFGPAEGFALADNGSHYFRATFADAGTYTLHAYIKDVTTGDTLCFAVATVTVKERSEISFTEDSIEIQYTDVNAANNTLVDNVEGAEYTYESDNEAVVKVSEYGILTPVSVGEAKITVTRKENSGYVASSATYTVKVVAGVQDALVWDNTVPDSIKWNDPNGYTNTVTGGSGDGEVTYTSSAPDVAEVDPATGALTLKKPGTVIITATKSGGELYEDQTATYTLVVVKDQQAGIAFTEQNPDAIYYGDTYTNAVTGDVTGGTVKYESSDDTIATVDENGKLTTLKQGTVTITATVEGNDYYEETVSISYTITIYRASAGLVFEKGTEGQTVKYGEAYANAVTGTNTANVTYSTSDDTVALVDSETGAVTALKAGKVTITATVPETEQYAAQSISYELEITLAEQVVEFENGTVNIPAITYGDPYQNGASATTQITYSTSDETIAEVDADGKLVIHKAGTVTITATAAGTEQYAEATASYEITIHKEAQTITFEKGEEVTVTFNDNENQFSNLASSNATSGGEEDIEITYQVSKEELLLAVEGKPGEFTVAGAGTITVTVTFSGNDRYESATATYTLTVNKADQTIAFDQTAYEMTNGSYSFQSPVITKEGTGAGAITYKIVTDSNHVVSAIDEKTGALTFTENTGTVTIIATKAACENYNAATAEYTLTVKHGDGSGTYHTVEGEKVVDSNGNVWFVGDTVSLKAVDGYLISYQKGKNADWQSELSLSNLKQDKNKVMFFAKDENTGNISSMLTAVFHVDTVVPSVKIEQEDLTDWEKFLTFITLNMWKPDKVTFTVWSDDPTSDIAKIEYCIVEGITDANLDELTWELYDDEKGIVIDKNMICVIYAKVTDNAGHHSYASTNGLVADTQAPEVEITVETPSYNDFYNGNVELKVEVDDKAISSGISSVIYEVLNGEDQTQSGELFAFAVENPTYGDLVSSLDELAIKVDAGLNNSDNVKVVVTVTDNAGNDFTATKTLQICTNKPTLEVTFEDDPTAIGTEGYVTYYDANRVAKIVITGRTSVFAASEKPVVLINDSTGKQTYEVIDWTTSEVEGEPDKATHTYTIKFNGSAVYEFSVDYTDIFGNNLTYASNAFAVDHDAPTASITIDEENTWTELLNKLTFGLWKNEEVTVKVSAEDATSPVKSVEYYLSNSTTILTQDDLNEVQWTAYEEFSVAEDKHFVVYLKVTDYVGHVAYFCSDGYIVDMQNSTAVLTPDAPNENGIYSGDFQVQINVEDKEPHSGIQLVEYWVTCDGEETYRKELYRFAVENPAFADLLASFSETVTVIAADNNSDNVVVHVRVVDNAGNETVTQTEALKVDVTAPKIHVSFDVPVANVVDGRGYLKTNRVATIVFTERTSSFNKEAATAGIVFSGEDFTGNTVELDRAAMIVWDETVEVPGDPDAATHTARVYFNTDANYDCTVSYTDQAGNACAYEDVTFAEGTEAPRYFTVDKKAPEASITVGEDTWKKLLEVLSFGLWQNKAVIVKAQASDITSPVIIEYYKTDRVDLLDKEDLDAVDDWVTGSEFDITKDERFVVYLKVTDYAGNYIYLNSDGYIVDMTESAITLTPDHTDRYHGEIPLYNKDVNVQITVNEKTDEAYSGIKLVEYWVKCDGKETQREILYAFNNANPQHADLLASFSKTVTIIAAENNSCDVVLCVGVTDNAGNYKEESIAVDIDVTDPTIQVTYDNNAPYKTVEDKGYFPAARKATVVITERTAHFNAEKATAGIQITAVDANGKTVIADCAALISEWKTEGTGDAATHTATIDFSADANYTFAISYTDLAGNGNSAVNTGDSETPYKFAVDTTAPTGTVTVGELGTWEYLLEVLTFGLWSKDTVDVTGTSSDATTPIESVSYHKTGDVTAKSVNDLSKVTEWEAFDGITVLADELFVVYLRIVDYAGNVTYIGTNGIIVDDTIPAIESVKPNITITPEPAHGVYHSDVAVSISVVDPVIGDTNAYAGLQKISYKVYNMGVVTQSGDLYKFGITEPTHGELLQTWSGGITVDKDLNNSNDVKIVVYAIDNAGNASEAECAIQIDITAPKITVTYDNNKGDTTFGDSVYFNADRTAKIVVTERNFDPDMVKLKITNTDGAVPRITGWKTVKGSGNGDGTTHTAYVVFSTDGDYTFSISCTDTAMNENTDVDYANSLAPKAFTVDKTAPVVSVVYDNNNVLNGNYYKAQRIATITVTEHNFETSRVQISLAATDNGVESALPTVSEWTSEDDVHTMTITYAADSYYVFDFTYNDKAGNATADIAEQDFYVDKTNPVLSIENIVDESANNDEGNIGFVMTATDTNFDVFTPVLTAVIRNGDTFETKQLEIGQITDIENGKVFTVTNLDADGIYRIICTTVDKAGNAYSEVILEKADGSQYVEKRAGSDTLVTFSVNRDGSTFELGAETTEDVNQYYIQNVDNDIVIIEINADPLKEHTVTLNGKELVQDTDYTVAEEGGNGAWMKYTYTVNKSLFAGEGEYKVIVSSKDKANNDAFSDVKDATIAFIVDRTAPVVTVSGLATDGRYQTDKQVVTLIPTDDGGALNALVVNLVDADGNVLQELINLSGEALIAELENSGGMITFEIAEGLYQNVQIICTDYAIGNAADTNTYNMTIENVSVSTSAFMIFWANKPLRWGTIGGVTAAVTALVVLIVLKKKKRKEA